jgi:hypothetical protein
MTVEVSPIKKKGGKGERNNYRMWLEKDTRVEGRGGHEASIEIVIGVDVSPVGLWFPTAMLLNDGVGDASKFEGCGTTATKGVTCVNQGITAWQGCLDGTSHAIDEIDGRERGDSRR